MTDPQPETLAEAVEDAAGEKLGLREWDRPAIFRQTADAATDADLPYWSVLLLSGAIATLGLATDSSAVVIGAMLVAPLLAPVVGLALSLAAGDGRLAFETAAVVLASTLAVMGIGALLTALLPFHTITLEISARTRPTTLDLGIAVFSGLAGAVVTVARGHRLSAAIPGVAISVALIPPLAVAGFGIGAGLNWTLIRGSLLLYGANLAGIVLSGMVVFMLVGMHRPAVLEAAERWHGEGRMTGLAAWTNRFGWVRGLGVMHSTWTRMALVLGFVVAVSIPLSATLEEIARERRVRDAVEDAAEAVFEVDRRSSVLDRRMDIDGGLTRVFLRVGTTDWFGEDARQEFERRASAAAAEPVHLVLEQLPLSVGDAADLARLFPELGSRPDPRAVPAAPALVPLPELLSRARERLQGALEELPLPAGVRVAGSELAVAADGGTVVRVGYASPRPLPPEAEQILARQVARALGLPGAVVR
ncbi:MAG TPA: DUF389 domain-containing protein, partial [Longimicrobiaceae bacterium]|nr:DUF389 domain-containing protein [Longimicrobiaceae bacterium]